MQKRQTLEGGDLTTELQQNTAAGEETHHHRQGHDEGPSGLR